MTDNEYIRNYMKPVMMGYDTYFGSNNYSITTTGAAKFASVVAPVAAISTVSTTDLSVSNNLRATHFDL